MSAAPVATRPASAFDDLDTIRDRLSGEPVLVALDFDGTLTEIDDDPQVPGLTDERRSILARIPTDRRRLAIVSGRALDDVRDRVGLPNVIYVGNHGLEIEGPSLLHRPPEDLAEHLTQLLETVADRLKAEGLKQRLEVEGKTWTVTLHVRPRSDARGLAKIEGAIRSTVEEKGFVLRRGKASLEIRPAKGFDKGEALRHVIGAIPGGSAEQTLYAGDDETDEDAFRALPGAITVRVGDLDRGTAARYRLADPAEVYRLLETLFVD